jgi:hypothetical protein
VARVGQLACADQILTAEFTGIETLILEVLPVQQIGGFAPSTLLVGSLYIGLTAQSFDVGLLDWIRPLCARADKGSMIVCFQPTPMWIADGAPDV